MAWACPAFGIVIMGRGLGASSAFTAIVTTGVNAFAPAHAQANPYYAEYIGDGTTSRRD
jgi:hypothetical protein